MKTVRYIGDVHGKMSKYLEIIKGCEESVQVGDFGAGFVDLPNVSLAHRWIRGNHDDPAICKQSENWIRDGNYQGSPYNTLYVGGAYSIDKASRIIGRDWWPDEEVGYKEFESIIEGVEFFKPKIIISHDCPQQVFCEMTPYLDQTLTRRGLQEVFELHQPKMWIFGHHHKSFKKTINDTKFICLEELEYIDIDVEAL